MTTKIIYETQTGTTQYVAELMQTQLQAAGHTVTLHSIKYDGLSPSLEGIDLVLFGAPTYDDGKLEKTMQSFISGFQPDLGQRKVAVFGLGNRSYPQFCTAADLLESWVRARGGVPLTETLKVDGFPDHVEKIADFVRRILAAV